MDKLWAPWRKTYIRPEGKPGRGCVFCKLLKQKNDSQNYILKRTAHSFAVLNLYPYNNGHVLVLPLRHVKTLSALTSDEKLDWLDLFEQVKGAVEKTMSAQGFNVGINLGRAAGAGIPGHLHLHIVPRWKGDSNFMPVVGRTKVISESLDSVYRLLSSAISNKGSRKKSK